MAQGYSMSELGDFPPLELDSVLPLDSTFEIAAPNEKAPAKSLTGRKTSTIFVRVKNETQFAKARLIISAALTKANIDHNL